MPFHSVKEHFRRRLKQQGLDSEKLSFLPVSGGSINETGKLLVNRAPYFCKLNSATKFPQLFRKEADGLLALEKTGVIRVPQVIDRWEAEDHQVLVLEWIDEGPRTAGFWAAFGESLAALHGVEGEYFGWPESNYMGSVVQVNTPERDWNRFFVRHRLEPLVRQCQALQLLDGRHLSGFEALYRRLPEIFGGDHRPVMIHGDLWSGNFLSDVRGRPVLIDPAVCFGHPSCDLAMTTLFGGFSKPFYDAYHHHRPLPANHAEQWEVCNLYPLLIHLLLFGASYLSSIERSLKRYQ